MQKSSLYALMAAGMLVATLVADHAAPRLAPRPLRAADLERLPQQIGEWRSGPDLPVDIAVRRILPHARLLTREYCDPLGRPVQLLLESSARPEEYHSPTVCMPGQGWSVLDTRTVRLGRAEPSVMRLQDASRRMLMLYWYTSDRQMDKWETLKAQLASGRPAVRVFARILVPAPDGFQQAEQTALTFSAAIAPWVDALTSTGSS